MQTIEQFENEKAKNAEFMKKYAGSSVYTTVFHEVLKRPIEALFYVGKKEVIYKGGTNGIINLHQFTKL